MRITKEMLSPSRDDAVRLRRTEKQAMLVMAYIATVYEDMQKELDDRLEMIENGPQRMRILAEDADDLLNELRKTIPVNQRMNLQNTVNEYEIRLTPKMTPFKTNVIMQKEEFKELVDIARGICVECAESDTECKACRLYQLLTVLLPLEDYNNGMLCPYNLGEWGN